MNSGNSASIQSSSTGGGSQGGGGSREDQELESRGGETISALLNPTSSLASFDNTSSLPAYYHHQVPNYKFHPPTFSQSMMINHNNTNNSNIVGNDGSGGDINNTLGMVWPNKYTLLQPSSINNTYSLSLDDANNCTSSSVTSQQQINTCATQSHQLERPPLPAPSNMDSTRIVKSSPGSLNQQGGGGGGRSNPKKRSRASRRTPTTVLTTDTNNFRQMVQEFTGIPASPFETAFAGRARLDLFGGFGIQLPRDVCSSTMQPPPHHLMRPFPQKIILPPYYPINVPNNITTSNSKDIIATTPSFHPHVTMEKFHVTGFQKISLPADSLMNEFALGHNISSSSSTTTTAAAAAATATTTTTCATTVGRHQVNSVDEGGGNNNVTTHPATVDSWICSSD